MGVYWVIGIHV